ncbi:SIMPL domain-containing protein [bacterium]|nr:SIMPL domain-containing protein [bacterium]
MENKSIWHSPAIAGIAVGLGLIIAGMSLGSALYKIRSADRFVTVKGLAEKELPADLAIWPITFKVASNDLASLQSHIDEKRKIITAFLINSGFHDEMISNASPKITDTQAERHYGEKVRLTYRYLAETTLTLRSSDVARVKIGMEKTGELVKKGVVMVENWENRTEFLFTGLNKIKPEMIEAATLNAREAAKKFAKDSGSKLGKIRHANQGFFSIADRDRNSPEYKKIRVVTTVQYYLVDR